MPTYHLEFINTAMRGKTISVRDGLLVGSGADCKVRANHPDLRSAHARFRLAPALVVEAAEAGAAIIVNGKNVVRADLRHRDELQVGPLRLRIIEDASDVMPAVARPAGRASGVMSLDTLLAEAAANDGDEIYDFAQEDLFYRTSKEPALRKRVAFVIPSKDKFIEQAQVFLARLVKHSGADELQVDNFMTCAKELVLNAHRHGHQYDESKRIILRFRDDGKDLTLVIEDEGKGFDHRQVLQSVKEKDAATAARERYLAGGFGGLGFQLITKLAKALVYNEPGNVVTLVISKQPEGDPLG